MLVSLSVSTPVPAAELDPLLIRLKRSPPVDEPYHDVRYRRALTRPLVSSGHLLWRGEFDFERRVDSPYQETARLEGRSLIVRRDRGGERVIPIARAPELEVLFSGLAALFAGDAAAIARDFEVELDGEETWRLRLRPKDPRLRERIRALDLRGRGDRVHCLVVDQPGAEVLSVFGSASAPQPGEDDLDTLVARLCPAP